MNKPTDADRYGNNEAQVRFRAALNGAISTPAKPHKAMRKGLPSQSKKPQAKGKRSP